MLNVDSVVVRNPDVMFSDLDNEVVLMNLETGSYYSLNPVGSEIWKLVESEVAIKVLIDSLMDIFNVERAVCESNVLTYLTKLKTIDVVNISG